MKNFLKISSLIFVAAVFFASCTSKKQHCDAYGSMTKIEKNKDIQDNKTGILATEKNS